MSRGAVARKLLVSMLALGVVVSACSSGSTAPPHPRRGGVLRVGVAALGSLDPALAATADQRLVATTLFSSLTRYDPVSLAVVPGLATSWKPDSELRRWDLTLRPGARFSDGRPVNERDVAATLYRIARSGSGSPVADLLAPIEGYAAAADGSAQNLAGVSEPQPGVVRISLARPVADLPSLLANPDFGIVASDTAPTSARADPAATSGPFTLVGRSADAVRVRSIRSAPGGAALLDGIDFLSFASQALAYQAFVHHVIDWAPVPPETVEDAGRKFGRDGYRPLAAELFYGFNLRDPVFADRGFRQAIVQAIDRGRIASSVYRGVVLPFSGLVVDGIPGHQADSCGPPCRYDPVAARSLLAAAFPGRAPPALTIDFDHDSTQELVAQAIQSNLAAVGVQATLRPSQLADYHAAALGGHVQLFRLGWVAPYPVADAFLSPLFGSGAAGNLTGYSDPAVDLLMAQARAEPDQARRVSKYEEAERKILAALPVIPIAQFTTHVVIAPAVHGLKISVLGIFDPSMVWLDKR